MQNSVICSDIFWDEDMLLHVWATEKINNISNYYIPDFRHFSEQNTWKLLGGEIINSPICIFISTVQEMLWWKLNTIIHNFISSLFFIRFTSNFNVLFEMFHSFNWINLNLDWISPLRTNSTFCQFFTLKILPEVGLFLRICIWNILLWKASV